MQMQAFQNAPAYFAMAVNDALKMFMKLTPVANVIKHFTSVIY
jgi:hypothetical protein